MGRYKRNQVEEAIAAAMGLTGAQASAEIGTRIKRLLNADRALGRDVSPSGPARPGYAFYSADAPGTGVEVWFSAYEAFALLLALFLLQHGWPQGAVVRIMRRVRLSLEPEHKRVLSQDRRELFDEEAVRKAADPGMIAVDNTDPVFLVIVTGSRAERAKADHGTGPKAVGICHGEAKLMEFRRKEAPPGASMTVLEVVRQAHQLADHLAKTKPRARGRAGR
jgi:hypothetical protein